MNKFCILTLGCRVNQYESEAVCEELKNNGLSETDDISTSDVIIVNTCAVTGESTRKSRQMIHRACRVKEKNPGAVVCVMGCASQGAEGKDAFRGADLVFGNTKKNEAAAKILEVLKNKPSAPLDFREDISKKMPYETLLLSGSKNARAFIKIEDGCDSFCSYCFVPFVRGRVRSRDENEVIEEAKRLSENGYSEVVLTGIETGAYGEDLGKKDALAALVEKVAAIEKIKRIRFGSLKPTVLTEEFAARLAATGKVMPHFHLSFQSGSDKILSAMNRRYTRADEEKAAGTVRKFFPDAGLSADIICGFPGETEKDFLDSVFLVKDTALLHTHIFPFSPREKTRAFSMDGKIPEETKKERCERLLCEARNTSALFVRDFAGKKARIFCEKIKDGNMFGYTENFIYTKTPAHEGVSAGGIFTATLTDRFSFSVESVTAEGIFGEI